MKTSTQQATDTGPLQSIETIFGTVQVYEFHPAMNGDPYGSPYLVVEVDTPEGVDRRVRVYVDDEEVFDEVPR